MAEIDSLSIQIKASTHEAITSIDRLIATLGKLSGALNISGVEGFTSSLQHISSAINAINTDKVERLSVSMRGLASAGKKLSGIGDPFGNVNSSLRELSTIQLSDTLENLNIVKDAVSKVGGKSGQAAGAAMKEIAAGLRSLNVPVPPIGEELTALANGLRALGSGNIVTASQTLPYLAQGLRELNAAGGSLTADAEKIITLANAVKLFGYSKMEKSIVNLPILATELKKLIETLASAPEVSNNTVELVKAIGNLNVNTRQLSTNATRAGRSLDFFSNHAKKAHKATFSLAATIGKIYATYWALFRVMGMFKNSIDLASNLTEVQNVVDHTFGDMKYRMEDFASTAVETIGMSELTAKEIGARFQAMGRNMGVPDSAVQKTNDFIQKATNGYANVADSMADVSINLTKLSGDMASFYNMDYEDVAEKMEAVFTGQTRPLRTFGLDLTQASLKAFALANGLNADIESMTQAEKTLLRYQYVMANTVAAQGDFERTIGTWANQVKLARENLKRLQIILGQIGINTFKPLVANFNAAMNDIIHLAESTFNSLGKIFGWQIEISDVGIVDDMADGLEDVGDGFDGARKEAKKFKNFLLGIDELNLLPDNDDKDSGSGAGDSFAAMASGMQDSLVNMRETESAFDSIYDTLYKLGARIGEVQKEWLKNIKWDDIYEKARNIGKGLASFLNGYLSDAELFYEKGRFIANGINTVSQAIYGFFHEFDGYQLGVDLGSELNGITSNLDWSIIKSGSYEMAHDLTETINGFFETANWKDVGHTIAEGINTAVKFVSTFWNEIHWDVIGTSIGDAVTQFFKDIDAEEAARMFKGKIQAILDLANNFLESADFEEIGHKIGQFLSELKLEDYADDIARLIWNLIKAGFNGLSSVVEEAPIEAALLLAFGSMKFSNFGLSVGGNMAGAASSAFTPKLTSLLLTDLGTLSKSASLTYKAGLVGTAIAAAIITAIEGYNLGIKLGEALFPEDAMWYTADAWKEAVMNIGFWDNAVEEFSGSHRSDFGYFKDDQVTSIYPYFNKLLGAEDGDTWKDVKDRIRRGSVYITDKDINDIKKFLEDSGVSASEINNLTNQLVSARDSYENGFKLWLSNNSGILERENITLVQAYRRYENAVERTKETSETFANLGKTIGSIFSKEQEITNDFNGISSGDRFARSGIGGNNIWTKELQNIENLNTKLFATKNGIEQVGIAFESFAKKDKSSSLADAFESVKTKAQEIGSKLSGDTFAKMFENIPQAFSIAWRDALTVMQEMWAQMAKWINENAKIEIPKTKVGKNEIGGGTVQLKVPKFDVGGSIPNNGQLFVANESGAEVVANMGRSTGVMNTDQMETAIANGMMKALAASGQTVQVVLNGDASTFFTAMVKENNNSIMRTGASPLRV